MAAVVQIDATIPVLAFSGDDYGAWSIQQSLNAKGYMSNVQPLQGQKKLQVRLKKIEGRAPNGAPVFGVFDDAVGKADIKAVAGSWFTTLAGFKEWTVTTTAKVVETAVDALPGQGTYSKAYEKAQLAIKNDGLLASLGIPWWVPWLVGGAAGLYVLNSVVSAKKTFLGGVNGGRRRGPRPGDRILPGEKSVGTNYNRVTPRVTYWEDEGMPAHLVAPSTEEAERADMKRMLYDAGYDPADVSKLTRDGIGPEELRKRIQAGSLENTHRVRRRK